MTTKGDNTPTNTLREQIEDIIVDTTMHPVEQSLKIEALVSQAVNKAEKNMWEKTTKAMRDILQENFHYRLMCGEVRDPDGKIDVMKEFVKYQELEPKRIKFSNYLEELKAKLETPNQVEGK